MSEEKQTLTEKLNLYDSIIGTTLVTILNNSKTNSLNISHIHLKDYQDLYFLENVLMLAKMFNKEVKIDTNIINLLKIKYIYRKRDIVIKKVKDKTNIINSREILAKVIKEYNQVYKVYSDIYETYYKKRQKP